MTIAIEHKWNMQKQAQRREYTHVWNLEIVITKKEEKKKKKRKKKEEKEALAYLRQ